MTPGNGVSIQYWGTAILLELKHSCPCLFQHAYSESKVDSPFYQKKSVFQKQLGKRTIDPTEFHVDNKYLLMDELKL